MRTLKSVGATLLIMLVIMIAWPENPEPKACGIERGALRERIELARDVHQFYVLEVETDEEWHEEWIETYVDLLGLFDVLEEDCK